ncbi:acetyltransferase [Aliivibrio sp. 1S165]|uniref:GNAT family N-acetyltransferase n=1 Tax=unclassified Aliivibrio TaxID=2645654 RepID=UPI00080EA403|nr:MULTISPECIES: GNAT family N-acetyltransferase [unclassified Aliivibrio]OCH12683.1 acetyltransferase [Aliivibrio sp. 1S165]OCH36379.1 acetyltransferase [Aliivibrio sp. 1S175]
MEYRIVGITSEHDNDICYIINNVGVEFGAAGERFAPGDDEVLDMSRHYNPQKRSKYLILLLNDRVVGGCGLAPFNGSETVCELRKLFLLPEARGRGFGKTIAQKVLKNAKEFGYTQCYLDTLSSMKSAIHLYEDLGFKRLSKPIDNTIHNGCDVWMLKNFSEE